jgi:dephospho-CoA kinase
MANYLITGVAGTGKSTLSQELTQLGCEAIDTDVSYTHWVERATGKSFSSRPDKGPGWADKYDWEWHTEAVNQLLQESSGDLFLCGVANNQADFYPLFQKIFLLTITPEAISERLTNRTNNNFGKAPHDIEQTLIWQVQFDQALLQQGAVIIDASLAIPAIAQEILRHARS